MGPGVSITVQCALSLTQTECTESDTAKLNFAGMRATQSTTSHPVLGIPCQL